ncbi:MAG: DNA polymerase III subunit gamma/tau [Omnitrophica bacterium]|nr:DNA polymerase III subunit gamma/tau [Candidatus Omnitrophota bacterium]
MGYLVFARKWRPQNFDQLIGQEHVATTLKNAISFDRVAHAYLFTGPRGIGKTSTARILAKALNCEKGPTPSPCNVCDCCREISVGRSLDVMEIDGASNRGIEQIRQLRENVKFAPAKSRFKIYIIDEVHQITTDGFNALLKTLEEPPAHVKFIFATTQAHKILPTILSRCQRFDFKPLSISSITQKLKKIMKQEKLDVTDEALLYIARASSGSMRDAESILDQVSSFCRGKVKLETVTSMLGMVDMEALWEISQKLIQRKTQETLILVEKIINQGKDLPQFIASLMEHFRNILIAKIVDARHAGELIDLPKEHLERISAEAKDLTFEEIFYIFNILVRTQDNLRRALSSRVVVEVALVKLTQRGNLTSLDEILSRLNKFEQGLGKAGVPLKENYAENNDQEQAQDTSEAALENTRPISEGSSQKSNHSWPDLLEAIKEEKILIASYLEFGHLVGLDDKMITVAFSQKHNFYKETLEQLENKKAIEEKAKEIFQRPLKIKFILDKNLDAAASKDEEEAEESGKKIAAEPIIQSALKIFQGRITKRFSQ